MIILEFKGNVGRLNNLLNDGDIIEMSYREDTKIVRVKVDERQVAHCSRCVLSRNGGDCGLLIDPPFDTEDGSKFSPCNSKLLACDKEYKYKFCIHYEEDISRILEDL